MQGSLPGLGRAARAERPAEPPPGAGRAAGPGELERSLRFLQQQHAETLRQLHQEIERLKRQNRDLHYRLIMQPAQRRGPPESRHSSSLGREPSRSSSAEEEATCGAEEAAEEERALVEEEEEEERVSSELLEEEEEAAAAASLMQKESLSLEQEGAPAGGAPTRDARASERRVDVCDRTTSPIAFPSPSQSRSGEVKIPTASSNPFLVNVLPSHMRKPPTLEECEVVIRQLWNINHMQMQEVMYLRSCLEDIHKTKRIPEDYMLAGQLGSQNATRLPRVKNAPRQWILTPLPAAERAVLPALKQTLGNAFAERQKRTQALQRNRLRRTAL